MEKNNILIDTTRCSKEEFDFITSYLRSESFNFKKVSRSSGTKGALVQKISDMKELLASKDVRISNLISEVSRSKRSNDQSLENDRQKDEIIRLNTKVFNLQAEKTTDEIERVTNQELTRDNKALVIELVDSKNLNKSLIASLVEVSKRIS